MLDRLGDILMSATEPSVGEGRQYLLADSSSDVAALNAADIFVVFEFVCVLDLYQETRADKVVSHNSVFLVEARHGLYSMDQRISFHHVAEWS